MSIIKRTRNWTKSETSALIDLVNKSGSDVDGFKKASNILGRTEPSCKGRYYEVTRHERIGNLSQTNNNLLQLEDRKANKKHYIKSKAINLGPLKGIKIVNGDLIVFV